MSHPLRVFIDLTAAPEMGAAAAPVVLSVQDAHHLRTVLRCQPGDRVTVVCRRSAREFSAEVLLVEDVVSVRLMAECEVRLSDSSVGTLMFALCKGKRNDLVCEKATELGAERIIFWTSERSVVRLADEASARRIERWERIAESAAKQSRRNAVPEIKAAVGVGKLIELLQEFKRPGDALLCFTLSEQAEDLRILLRGAPRAHLLIGPEGDLSPAELDQLCEHGFRPASLGPYVLRSETAAIAALAVVQSLGLSRGDP